MSTTGKEYKLAIRIAGTIDKSFTTSLTAANSSLKQTITNIDKDFTKLDKGFDKIMSAGQKCFSAITTAAGVAAAAIGAATAASIAVGSEFESAFAGVKKTVDATEEEYAKLKQDILDMTKTIPSSASDIAAVMEIAGQLGIAKDSLTDFTETMINMGVSTNLSAEDAATALAKFANITGMDSSDFERLGSVIVDLGNKFATTEEDIVNMATRLASTGDLVGLSESQIMALATAMSSVGIASESGGSTMSKLLKKMQIAVETNSDSLADYASVAGMTGKQFKETFQKDAVVALSAFIDGIDDVERNGKSAIAVLDDMGLNEVRLSNTILALAGGEDVMSKAISVANEAWEENTALAIEAGKRYETAESQVQLMQNAFEELGIVAYEELREPYVDVISTITDKVHDLTEYVGGPDGISSWMDSIGTALPTLQRKFKKYGEPVFNGITSVGKWLVKHGDGVIAVLSGIGGAMAAYKIASTGVHLVKTLTTLASMNPATWAILGVVGVIGAITTAYSLYKQHEQDLIDSNLADHFGNIALSMEDIQAVAEHIVSTDSLGGVKEALEAFEDLDTFSSTMENSVKEINKMNWKVSIGMELTEDEQEQYKTAIDEYVSAANDYVLQSQYAVSLNLAVGLGDSEEGASIISKVNQFYQDSYDEMTTLGQNLSNAVNEAFADNVLDPDEINVITDLQAKMAEVQRSLATGEFDAQLSLLGTKYASGGSLTAESFQNLQSEIATQTAAAVEAYEEAYVKNYAAIQAAYDEGDPALQIALDELYEQYLKDVGEVEMKGLNFQVDTIMQQYSEEIEAFREHLAEVIAEYSGDDNLLGWQDAPMTALISMAQDIYDNDEVDKATRMAIEKLMTEMQPTIEQAEELKQKYAELGVELSDEMLTTFANIDLLGAITARDALYGTNGDVDSLYSLLESEIVNNEAFEEVETTLRGYGWELPEAFAEEVPTATQEVITPAVEGMYAWSQQAIDEYFSQGFSTQAGVSIQLNPTLNGLRSWSAIEGINHRANGGLATSPELTWFAENSPEMAIPIDGSRNAISLWKQTGRLLGMNSALDGLDLDGGSSPSIEYSPVLQFYGDAPSKSDLEDALRVSQDEFESLMERYIKTHGRVSFG